MEVGLVHFLEDFVWIGQKPRAPKRFKLVLNFGMNGGRASFIHFFDWPFYPLSVFVVSKRYFEQNFQKWIKLTSGKNSVFVNKTVSQNKGG